jgi:putative membrane-bound dehydrogenase-like protein
MKRVFLLACFLAPFVVIAQSEAPLRVFIRGGVKTHGPGQHDHPRFLQEWKVLLNERGAKADGGMDFPAAEQLEKTDVMVMYAAEGGTIKPDQRESLDKFLKRGGGLVVIHDAVCGTDPQWFKTIVGGAWEHRHSKWFEGDISLYYVNQSHPITTNCSNFDFDDEVYWDLHLEPEARILAASWKPDARNTRGSRQFPHIYDVIPQIWVYEKTLEGGKPYRAFISIPGHQHKSFSLPHYRAVLLRGIAWAGHRKNVDEFCSKDELASVRYPEGGPTAPEKAAAKLELHPDFRIGLVAAEPLINKPIALDWDAAGRLWVAETPEYPNGRRGIRSADIPVAWKDHGSLDQNPDRPAYDRISILSDPDGDGRMDKKQVFYEGLELVTGFVFHEDGVIVCQAPEVLWLRDVDGDGKAEKVEKLYTGLGTYDTHAVINNLRRGFDGWIYATHGYSASDHVRNGDGSKDFGRIVSGVVRFKPDGSAFEQYSSKGGNTWGLDVAWDNEIFFTQPTSGDLLNHVVTPESVLALGKVGSTPSFKPVIRGRRSNPIIKYENLAYVQIDVVGGFTASAGCAIYDGGAWPSDWNYGYFTTEPTINIIHHESVAKDGVTFTANKTRDEEFIGGRDPWFRPIETRIGPDGALYILDFYNQAVIHNDTRGPKHNAVNAAVRPDRDHYFGRIWRVQHKSASKLDIPDLTKASGDNLAKALEHPNQHVRMTALRLISEKRPANIAISLKSSSAAGRVAALWALHHTGALTPELLATAAGDTEPAVRKNALMVAAESAPATGVTRPSETAGLKTALQLLKDPDARIQLHALRLLAGFDLSSQTEAVRQIVSAYPRYDDPWLRSAAVAAANKAPAEAIAAIMRSPQSDQMIGLASAVVSRVAGSADASLISQIITSSAAATQDGDAIVKTVLETIGRSWKSDDALPWSAELQRNLSTLLEKGTAVRTATLPLVARWDKTGALADKVKPLIGSLLQQLNDAGQSDAARADIAASLVGVRQLSADIVPELTKLLGSSAPASLQQRVIEALGSVTDPGIGATLAAAYPKLSTQLQEAAFAQLIKRKEWSLGLVDALKAGSISPTMLGPTAIHRLRTHSDRTVAQRANSVLEELRGPEAKQKDELIARLTPVAEKGGNAEQGRQLFAQNCGTCHKIEGQGSDLAPDLTGMGAHGVHELLTHILDPNRFVEPNYVAWSIETSDGESYDGIIARENRDGLTLRHASGEMEIKRENIKSQRNTGRSLMPEGFEALGDEPLRDLITYIRGSDLKFKIVDLKPVFTASTTRGLFNSPEAVSETLRFRKFGVIKAGDVPFEIVSPARATTGNNILVLKGGSGYAKTVSQRVEVPVGLAATKLHFLSGVGGWAWPFGGEDNNKGMPVAKVTVQYGEGATEEIVLKNGVEFVDYINASYDAPGSQRVDGLVERGQVRRFSKPLQRPGLIQKLVIESYDNSVAPVFVAITAETGEGGHVATESKADSLPALTFGNRAQTISEVRALIVGGGSSHDFDRWFNRADASTLMECAPRSVQYTDKTDSIYSSLTSLDVLYLSNNQPIKDPAGRTGIFDFAESGRGLLLVHPALWYNWADWPEYNRVLVGGGAKSHDKYGEFEVIITDASHPVMAGVPPTFRIQDELYHFKRDEQGTPMQVLATGRNLATGKTYPVVWITQHPKARVACITLGHDGAAHEHPAYKAILKNSFVWASGAKAISKGEN